MRSLACLGAALVVASCGGGGDGGEERRRQPAPAPEVDAGDVRVVRGWADTLRRGDVRGAARYFALPAIVSNGTRPIRLDTRPAVRFFNRTLPCGAKFAKAVDTGAFVVATLVLTERPGRGRCGAGAVGNEVYTAFLIRRHRIVQWRRVTEPAPEATPAGPQS